MDANAHAGRSDRDRVRIHEIAFPGESEIGRLRRLSKNVAREWDRVKSGAAGESACVLSIEMEADPEAVYLFLALDALMDAVGG